MIVTFQIREVSGSDVIDIIYRANIPTFVREFMQYDENGKEICQIVKRHTCPEAVLVARIFKFVAELDKFDDVTYQIQEMKISHDDISTSVSLRIRQVREDNEEEVYQYQSFFA